jgi:hypothetical protein
MSSFTRGFTGRDRTLDPRLPPGQYEAGATWPILTAEATPSIDLAARPRRAVRHPFARLGTFSRGSR